MKIEDTEVLRRQES